MKKLILLNLVFALIGGLAGASGLQLENAVAHHLTGYLSDTLNEGEQRAYVAHSHGFPDVKCQVRSSGLSAKALCEVEFLVTNDQGQHENRVCELDYFFNQSNLTASLEIASDKKLQNCIESLAESI